MQLESPCWQWTWQPDALMKGTGTMGHQRGPGRCLPGGLAWAGVRGTLGTFAKLRTMQPSNPLQGCTTWPRGGWPSWHSQTRGPGCQELGEGGGTFSSFSANRTFTGSFWLEWGQVSSGGGLPSSARETLGHPGRTEALHSLRAFMRILSFLNF